MDFVLALDAPSSARYEDLQDWLAGEPDLRPLVKRETLPPRQGELGGVVGALTVAVGSGGALTVLAGALGAWLAQERNRRARIKIELRRGRLRSIELDAENTSAADIERMLRALRDEA
ncbi:hypothetical protein [Dactylosporangium sp. NPDC048998]|uniref:effector-associated constant component EACC1 n=1 Tax=Dactylosporangium sp. NPDC048998 TaxID=3363976 RepID=UPI00371CC1DB